MKKIGLGLVMSCILAISITACSNANVNQSSSGTNTNEITEGTSNGDKANEPLSDGKKTILLSSFWPDTMLQDAKKKYEALHPNIEIKLESGYEHYSGDGGNSAQYEADLDKYVTTTNTEMMVGKGPDLLVMGQLPTDSYVKHNLLVDLGEMMDQDSTFHKEDYFSNILDSVRSSKGLYSMPIYFSLVDLIGDEGAIANTGVKIDDKTWSWNDFLNTATQLMAAKGKYTSALTAAAAMMVGTPPGPEDFLANLVNDNYSLFINEGKADFDSGSFTDLMKQIKSMYDDGTVTPFGPSYFTNITLISPKDYLLALESYDENMKLYTRPHTPDMTAGGYFATGGDIGINANSKVKSEAWDFLKFLMSNATAGFPISKQGFAQQVQHLKDEGTVTAPEGLHGEPGRIYKVDEAKLDLLDSFVSGAIHPVEYNVKVREIILKESVAFFTGQKPADNVAKLIQNKITTYLNE